MTEFVKYSVGEPYPISLPSEGIFPELLRDNGSRLIISMRDIDKVETKAFKKGAMRCGMIHSNGAILLLWQFLDQKKRPLLSFDSVFDVRINEKPELHSIRNSLERLVVEIHVVESTTGLIKALRAVTMSNEVTVEFLSAVQDQIASNQNGEVQINEWLSSETLELIDKAVMHNMGE